MAVITNLMSRNCQIVLSEERYNVHGEITHVRFLVYKNEQNLSYDQIIFVFTGQGVLNKDATVVDKTIQRWNLSPNFTSLRYDS
jgi:hypothetical protein